jgi:hypothetical protein
MIEAGCEPLKVRAPRFPRGQLDPPSLGDVREDVRRLEQAKLAQLTDGATVAVRLENESAKSALVEPRPRLAACVLTPG